MIDKFKTASVYQLFRYLVVGGLNTALSLAVYYACLHFAKMPYYLASAAAVLLGIVVGFKAHGALVFKSSGSFFGYVMVWLCIYLGNIAMLALVRDYLGDYWSPIALLPLTTLLAYVLLKRLVYKNIQY